MNIVFSSVVWEEVGAKFRSAMRDLESILSPVFEGCTFGGGVGQFIAVAIAVGDEQENFRFCKQHDKMGSYTHPISGEKIKFISFAIPMDADAVESMSEGQLRELFCEKLLDRLTRPALKIPKSFDYDDFSSKLKDVLMVAKRATFPE